MPFTYFAHQAFVLPLKWARPRWFDGTALCLGSMAPDWAYAFEGTRFALRSHSLGSLLWWSLPVTLLATWLLRSVVAVPLGDALPGRWGQALAALSTARRSLPRTALSALIGAGSHVFVDGFTHTNGWATRRSTLLAHWIHVGGFEVQVSRILQYAGHVFGTLAGALMLLLILRNGRIEEWSREGGAPAASPMPGDRAAARRRLWWAIAAGAALGVLAAASALHTGGGIPVGPMRASWAMWGAIVTGAVLARSRPSIAP